MLNGKEEAQSCQWISDGIPIQLHSFSIFYETSLFSFVAQVINGEIIFNVWTHEIVKNVFLVVS
jgi:hypothetical protein